MYRQWNKRVLYSTATGLFMFACFFSGSVYAWGQPYAWQPPPFYEYYAPGQGFHGYAQPRWYLRGRINRYGDYQFDLKLQGLSRHDMYRAWLMYQQLRMYRR